MMALIQLKALQKGVSQGVLTEHFLKACRPVNNQALGDPALSAQERQAVSTMWHCAVTTYHSWALSQPSAVWKHHSTYLFPPYRAAILAAEHTHQSQPTIPFPFVLFCFPAAFGNSGTVQFSNLSLSVTTNPLQIHNEICTFKTIISHNTLFWLCLSHYSCWFLPRASTTVLASHCSCIIRKCRISILN